MNHVMIKLRVLKTLLYNTYTCTSYETYFLPESCYNVNKYVLKIFRYDVIATGVEYRFRSMMHIHI